MKGFEKAISLNIQAGSGAAPLWDESPKAIQTRVPNLEDLEPATPKDCPRDILTLPGLGRPPGRTGFVMILGKRFFAGSRWIQKHCSFKESFFATGLGRKICSVCGFTPPSLMQLNT